MHVLGTAGHVDHGKSTLIERLTGIDPDRLAEEKARGLTIDLGFGWLTLPSGREVGIVDVPGHERFVHNMLAGVGSIDATIFVVAANEGWKPQSEEHLAILDLLGARGGVVALTKSDLADPADMDAISTAVRARLAGTSLEAAPIMPVSAPSGDGINGLIHLIDEMLELVPPAEDRDRARLFVDRSFSIKGAGTVVTGTLTGGRLRIDDAIEVQPAGLRGRIRSIQTHKLDRIEAEPGSRVALNIAGLDRDEVERGDAVVTPGRWRSTVLIDVWIRPVRGLEKPITGRGAYTFHLGSAETDARIRLLDAAVLDRDGRAFARISLARPVVADAFDRFVLRDRGRNATVAGGEVLDPHPLTDWMSAKQRAERIAELSARRAAGREGLAGLVVAEREVIPAADMGWLAGTLAADGPVRGYAVSEGWLARTSDALTEVLARFHRDHPLERGMPREDARVATGVDDQRLFGALVDALAGRVEADGPRLLITDHRVALTPEQQAQRDRVLSQLDAAGLAPPTLGELASTHDAGLVSALVEAGDLVRFSPEFALSRGRYEEVRRIVADAIRSEGPITTSRLREIMGTSRKYAIPLLEHLDAVGFTRRRDDVRELAAG